MSVRDRLKENKRRNETVKSGNDDAHRTVLGTTFLFPPVSGIVPLGKLAREAKRHHRMSTVCFVFICVIKLPAI